VAGELQLILAAARAGRVTRNSAIVWAQRAAAGEDISVLAQLAPGPERVTERDATRLATELATILSAGAGDGSLYSVLFGPGAAERRHARREAAAGRMLDYSDDEVYEALFGTPPAEPDDGLYSRLFGEES
jgi:hypothetical protein